MIHHSCDICGRTLNAETERRYEVKLDIRPVACDQVDPEAYDDVDPLELLETLIISQGGEVPEPIEGPRCLKYDLCDCCHKKFLTDPLGRKARLNIHFSAN